MFNKRKNKKKEKDKKSLFNKLVGLVLVDEEENIKNKVTESKKVLTGFEGFFIGFVFLILGIITGCLVTMYTSTVLGTRIDSNTFEFLKTFNDIKENYYEDVNEKKLIDAAIAGMLSSLGDEHSYYMDSSSTTSFNNTVDGKYTGVGITIQYKDDITTIIDIFKDSPADKAGIKVGDIITKVDDTNVEGKDSTEIASLISGDIGKKVTLTLKRGEEEIVADVVLAEIELESVKTEIKEVNGKKIGYIAITNFASNTYKQFNSKLAELDKEEIDSLIIDVRSNTGGHLSVVSDILDLFFKKDTVLYQIQDKKTTTKYKAKTADYKEYPVVILTNHGSASASEVLTACFKENYKNVKIVGTTTYGKGTVQQAFNLTGGSSYKFTTQKWLTPKGKWINEVGIKPDVEVELGEDENIDNQLDESIKILSE